MSDRMMASSAAVITGCGAVSPLGCGVPTFWQGLLAGRSGLAPIRSFDTCGWNNAVAGEVKDFIPEQYLTPDETRRLDRVSQYAVTATREALQGSALDLDTVDRSRVGVILATTLGGMLIGEAYQQARHAGRRFPARELLQVPYYAVSARVARWLNVRGPVVSPSIACASGTHAIGMALDLIRQGHADVCIVGGAEALCPFVVHGFNCLRATTADTVRPFDARRDGLLLGEGAAVLVVEDAKHAERRGAAVSVEVAGAGLAGDAAHITAPAPDGSGAARAMSSALRDAGVSPTAVDFVSAHGTGTRHNDAMEVAAIRTVFGESASRIPVNSIKGAIGHTLGAAGSFEAIMAVQVLREGVIPPTVHCDDVDPACSLDVVREQPRRREVRAVLSTSSAFAGNNAAVVLRRPPARTDQRRGSAVRATGGSGGEDVVVTGIGLVSPRGSCLTDLTERFAAGVRAPEGEDFLAIPESAMPLDVIPAEKRLRIDRMDRLCQLLLVASYLAIEHAGLVLRNTDRERVGLSFGTGLGCLLTNAAYNWKIVEGGPAAASPRLFAYTVSSAAAGEVSIALGIKGPNVTAHMGLAAGLGAVGYGADLIQTGKADVVLAAGADVVGPALVDGLRDLGLLKAASDGTTPFRDAAPGIFPAEGAVVVVLEGAAHARARGAPRLARLEGYSAGFEPTLARHQRAPKGIAATLRRALERSGRSVADTGLVFTSAHGTPLDEIERSAVAAVFGSGTDPILFAPKACSGEAFGASGALALALAVGTFGAPVAFGEHVGLGLDGRARSADEVRHRAGATPAIMINAVCYTGNVVTLVIARDGEPARGDG